MSWTFRGRRYNNYQDYLDVQRRYQEEEARGHARRVADENERLRNEVRRKQQEMEGVRGDLARMNQLQQSIRQDVAAMQRNQQWLESEQRRMEHEMQAQVARIDQELAEATCRITMGERQIQDMKQKFQQHVQAVSREFVSVRQEMSEGLQEAEQRRSDTERRLQGEIDGVRDAFEEDRRARLAKESSQRKQAEVQVRLIEEMLARYDEDRYARLNLTQDVRGVRNHLASARMMLDQSQDAVALSTGMTAFSEAISLDASVHEREAALAECRRWVAAKVEELRARTKDPGVQECYAGPLEAIEGRLARIADRVKGRYERHAALEIERREDEQELHVIEDELRAMEAKAPVVRKKHEERIEQVYEVLDTLEELYGKEITAKYGFDRTRDWESPMTVIAENVVGNEGVTIRVHLDGALEIAGYGHSSDSDCSRQGRRVLAKLESTGRLVTHQDTGSGRRAVTPIHVGEGFHVEGQL